MTIGNLTESITNMTKLPLELTSPLGIVIIIIGIVLVVLAFYVVYKVLKNLIANAIIGGIGLIVMHFLFPTLFHISIPINLANIIICLVAGIPGLIIVIILSVFGIAI